MLWCPELNQRRGSVLLWLMGLRTSAKLPSCSYRGKTFSWLRWGGTYLNSGNICTGQQEHLLKGLKPSTKFCDHLPPPRNKIEAGLRHFRKLAGCSQDIMNTSVPQIIHSRGKHFFVPQNGLLLFFHPNQWKEQLFLVVPKELGKWLVRCLLKKPL